MRVVVKWAKRGSRRDESLKMSHIVKEGPGWSGIPLGCSHASWLAQVPLINGFDIKGGARPPEVHWRWDAEKPDRDHAQRGLNCRV